MYPHLLWIAFMASASQSFDKLEIRKSTVIDVTMDFPHTSS